MRDHIIGEEPLLFRHIADDRSQSSLQTNFVENCKILCHFKVRRFRGFDFDRMPASFVMNDQVDFLLSFWIPIEVEIRHAAVMHPALQDFRDDEPELPSLTALKTGIS